MARLGMKSKLKRLEKRTGKRRVARVAVEYRVDANGKPTSPAVAAWLSYPHPGPESVPAALCGAYAGILAPRVMLLPTFGTETDWATAAERQQKVLLAVARSRTNEPTNVAPDSVGIGYGGDIEAPTRKGEKGKRFIELPDGRTFDRVTGEFEGG